MGWASWHGHDLLSLLCVFAVGALLARRLDAIAAHGRRLAGSVPGWGVVLAASAVLLMARWELAALGADPRLWVPVGRPAATLGAVLLVFAVLHCGPLRAVATSRPLQWLGAVSFSLYLVHEPIVVTLATLTPVGVRGFAVVLAVGIPLSLVGAVLFSRLVERPSRRLAAWAGRERDGRGRPLRSGA
jgi:peptidoglycan/LPS O-acetylase OafA/YrhL